MPGLTPGISVGARLAALRRQRRWSQHALLLALEAQAGANGTRLASRPAMKVNISRWENDHQTPDEFHSQLLAQVFQVTQADLGLAVLRGSTGHHGLQLTSRLIGSEVIAYLEGTLQHYVRADQLLGPGHVRGVVAEQAKHLEALCSEARGDARRSLLHLLARYAEFLGWLCQDSADLVMADRWTGRAGELAQLVDDPLLASYIAMRRAAVLAESDRAADSLSFAELALKHPAVVTPRLAALAHRQLAVTHAVLGDQDSCRAAADAALEAIETPDDGAFELVSYCSPAYVRMEAGTSLAAVGSITLATQHLTLAAETWPIGQHRDKGLCLARLADIHAAAGDVEAACVAAGDAVDLLAAAPSARTGRTLRMVRNRLHVHRRSPAVQQLASRLADVV